MFTTVNAAKASAWRSITKHSTLHKVIKEAIDSPIGSTKRDNLRGVLKSVGKNFYRGVLPDGQGGPGALPLNTSYNQSRNIPAPVSSIQTPPMSSVPSPEAPMSQSTYFLKPAIRASQETVGNQNLFSQIGNFVKSLAPGRISSATSTFASPESIQSAEQKRLQEASQLRSSIGSNLKSFISAPTDFHAQQNTALRGQKMSETGGLLGKLFAPSQQQYAQPIGPTQLSLSGPQSKLTPVSSGTPTPSLTGPMTRIPEEDSGLSGEESQKMVDDYLDIEKAINSYGAAAVDTWYNGLPEAEKSYYKEIYAAVKGGQGVNMFVYNTMNDRALMKKYFPNTPEDQLPIGASLAGQTNKLLDTLQTEFRIQEQQDNLLRKINTGLTLQNDLTSYIRGKDEYLGAIDKMLDGAKEAMAYSDTSSPYAQERLNNYTNYLTILKGRQNQRYMDFLDQSINLYNAQSQQAQNLLTTSLNQVEQRFTKQAAILEEDYSWAKTVLADAYNTVAGQEQLAQDRWTMENERTQAANKNILDSLEILNKQKELAGGLNRALKDDEVDTLNRLMGAQINQEDKKTITGIENFDIQSLRSQAAIYGIPEESVDEYYMNAVANTIKNQATTGSFSSTIDNLRPNIDALIAGGKTEDAAALGAQSIASLTNGLRTYLNNNSDNVLSILESLVGKGFGGEAKDRKSFIENNKNKISADLLGEIYDLKEVNKKAIQSGGQKWKATDWIDFSQTPEQIVNSILLNLQGMWENSFI